LLKNSFEEINTMLVTRNVRLAVFTVLLVTASLAVAMAAAQDDTDIDEKIESAMSAAPAAISAEATIIDEDGTVLREGTNGWVCHPDWTVSPGNDPACQDAVWEAAGAAMASGEDWDNTEIGVAYMLQGGSDPSNTDPMAMEPAEGEDWVTTPPHIMIRLPVGTDISYLSTDHTSGQPYVMFAGTPFEHIMIPVDLVEMDH
jgi:hypothetical protein